MAKRSLVKNFRDLNGVGCNISFPCDEIAYFQTRRPVIRRCPFRDETYCLWFQPIVGCCNTFDDPIHVFSYEIQLPFVRCCDIIRLFPNHHHGRERRTMFPADKIQPALDEFDFRLMVYEIMKPPGIGPHG